MVTINGRKIGDNETCYIVAELSGNHGGSLEKMLAMISMAKAAGADAIKIQTYRGDTITLDCDREDFAIPTSSPWADYKTLYNLYNHAHTPWEWHEALFAEAARLGMTLFSSPFDATAVGLLEQLGCHAYKIASPEINDIPLIAEVARTGKPIILSTGLASGEDIELALNTLINNGCREYALLKCTTEYPAPVEEANLLTIPDMKRRFGCPAGLSDHTMGITVPVVATALGANIIEKHFIDSRDTETVDSFFSLDEQEFGEMVASVRAAEMSLGRVCYEVTDSAKKNLRGRKSIYVAADIEAGELFTPQNLKVVRPGMGLHPKYYAALLGKRAKVSLRKGDRMELGNAEA